MGSIFMFSLELELVLSKSCGNKGAAGVVSRAERYV